MKQKDYKNLLISIPRPQLVKVVLSSWFFCSFGIIVECKVWLLEYQMLYFIRVLIFLNQILKLSIHSNNKTFFQKNDQSFEYFMPV